MDGSRTRRSLGRAGEALNHSLQATRRLVFGLRPPLLDTQGLVAALEAAAFRAVQEALTNVVQHANASRLLVTGRVADSLLAVEVVDDGIGFSPDTERQAPGDGHQGMCTMAEWIQLAGGGERSSRRRSSRFPGDERTPPPPGAEHPGDHHHGSARPGWLQPPPAPRRPNLAVALRTLGMTPPSWWSQWRLLDATPVPCAASWA